MENPPQQHKGQRGGVGRRRFLKGGLAATATAIGLGGAPVEVVKSELEGNKERKGNAVTITLQDGKKVTLLLGKHSEAFAEGQILPETEILAIEDHNDLPYNIETENIFLSVKEKGLEAPEFLSKDIINLNNAPIYKEMIRSGKSVFQCDLLTKKDTGEINSNPFENLRYSTGYLYVSLASLSAVSALSLSSSSIPRREFLTSALAGLTVGLANRGILRGLSTNTTDDLRSPQTYKALTQLAEKYQLLDHNSKLGKTLSAIIEGEETVRLFEIIVTVRSIIMAIKLKSALRMSGKKSIAMTLGADHILVEDFVTMSDEELIKKLIPFKDGLKEWFLVETLYRMTSINYGSDRRFHSQEQDDPELKQLVEKYLN